MRITILFLISLACIPLLFSIRAFAQEQDALMSNSILSKKISVTQISNVDFQSVLGDLAMKYDIPIGVEESVAPSETDLKRTIILKDPDLRQVLNAITQVAPQYRWEEVNGVINVVPLDEREPMLDIRLPEFIVDNMSAGEIVDAFLDSAEVRNWLLQSGLTRDQTSPIPTENPKPAGKLSFRLANVSIRDILNHIVRTSANKYWSVYRLKSRRHSFSMLVW